MKIALATLLALTPVSSLASPVPHHSQAGYSSSRTCFKTEYREEYIPGTAESPGYVRSWNDTLEVPCRDTPVSIEPRTYRRHVTVYENVDTNNAENLQKSASVIRAIFQDRAMIPSLKATISLFYADPQWLNVRPTCCPSRKGTLKSFFRTSLIATLTLARFFPTHNWTRITSKRPVSVFALIP